MSEKLFILLAIAGCAVAGCLTSKGEATPQAKPDKMPTVIVYAVDAIEPEKKAADELKDYLTKISGGNYSSLCPKSRDRFGNLCGRGIYPPHGRLKPDHRRRSAQRHLEWSSLFSPTGAWLSLLHMGLRSNPATGEFSTAVSGSSP
jgi:hypothetical protein